MNYTLFNQTEYLLKLLASFLLGISVGLSVCFSQCPALDVNAGPDQNFCDSTQLIQLQGSISGTYFKFHWTPGNQLSDSTILDPIVTGSYSGVHKFTLTAEGISGNLIINGDFENGNAGFGSQYKYFTLPGKMPPGYYTVDLTPPPYHLPEWEWYCTDHTSGSGNMMIVNGSNSPCNLDFWTETVTVKPNTKYDFQAFFASIYPNDPANIQISFNGVIIKTLQLGIVVCDWTPAMYTWNSGAATTLKITMRDLLCGNTVGNDFIVDDISLIGPCEESDDVLISFINLVAKINILKKPKCSIDVFDLTGGGSSTGPNIKYTWSTDRGKIISQIGLNAKGQGPGTYKIKVVFNDGKVNCEAEAEIEVVTYDLEGTLEVEGIANCKLDTVHLTTAITANGSGNYTYQWIPPNKILRGQNDSVAYVTESGTYKVVITDLVSGCQTVIQSIVASDTLKPNLQILGDTLISCLKNQVLLFGNSFDTSKYSYEWLLPDSSRIKNKDSVVSKNAGVFSLKVIDKINTCYTNKTWNVKIDTVKPEIDLGPDQNIDCINTDVTILPTGNNLNAVINYYWTLPSGILPLETNLQNKKETKEGMVFLRLVNTINGCEDSDTLFIKDIRKIPFVDAGNGTILNCKIKDYTLDGTNTKTDSSKYVWSTSNGHFSSGATSLTPNINAPGWYYLILEDTINHCKNIDSVFIDQNSITPNAILGPDKIFTCADTVLTLDGSNSNKGGQLKYNWLSSNGIIDSGQGSSIIKITSSGDYYLVVLDTINFCSDTALISVKPDLNAPLASISVKDTLTCLKTSVNIYGNASSPAGNPITYSWSASTGQQIKNANSLTPIVNEVGEYILTVIDQVNGCMAIARINVRADTIKPNVDAGPDNNWNCKSLQLTLDGSKSSANHALQFLWTTVDGIIIGNAQQNKIEIAGPGTYFLKVIDIVNGCESTDQVLVQKDLNAPLAIIQTPDTLNCIKSTITISGQGSSVGNRIIYNWKTTNGQILGGQNQMNLVVDKAGNYQLIVTDTINGCTQQQSVIVIEDKKRPIVDAGSSIELTCQLIDATLSGTIQNNTGNEQIIWTTNQGNILSKPDSQQIKINKPGIYYLEVTNSTNGCDGLDSVLVTKLNNLLVDAGVSTELTCKIKAATLSGSIQNNAGNEQLNWTTNQGHFIGNTNSQQVIVDKSGWYYFVVTNNVTGCNGIDSVLITENTNIPVSLNLNIEQPKCPGDYWQTEITNIVGGEKPIQIYLDNQFINGIKMQGNNAGNFIIKVVDKNGCEFSSTFDIISVQGVTVQLIPLVRLTEGDDYNLEPMYSIADDSIAEVHWSPADFLSCMDCPYPIIKRIGKDIEYKVSYTNRNGCIATARIRIELIKKNIWVPNVFSPNGDNINDWFYPTVTEDSYNRIRSMSIYDRWGNEVFEKENFQPNIPTEGWNGEFQHQKMNPGVYVYVVEVEWKNGERQLLKGDLTLIR